jgi:hypothetical protein
MDYYKKLRQEIIEEFKNTKMYKGNLLLQAKEMNYYAFREFYKRCQKIEKHIDSTFLQHNDNLVDDDMLGYLISYSNDNEYFLENLSDKEFFEYLKYITWYPKDFFEKFYSAL